MRAGRLQAILGALLVASGLFVASAGSASAATSVSTESELRTALANPATTDVVLANSIDLADCTPSGGDLDRAGAITIDGAGFTIRQTCTGERVIESSSGTLTLDRVTITGGNQTGVDVALGGGVLAANDLVLEDATVTHNTLTVDSLAGGTFGSGFGGGVEADGSITITGSHVDENSIVAAGGTYGGGILSGGGEQVTITDSTVDRNTTWTTDPTRQNAAADGGGVALVAHHQPDGAHFAFGGSAHLVRSSASENVEHTQAAGLTFAVGGGVFADDVVLEASHVDANELRPVSSGSQGAAWGGGLLTATTVTATGSTIDRNVIAPEGPSQSGEGGGVFVEPSGGHVDLTDSTVSGNTITTTQDVAACAGLITEDITLTRAEISGNHGTGASGAIGGGMCGGTATVSGSAISGNSVASASGDASGGGAVLGGGTIRDSTISGNSGSGATAHGAGILHRIFYAQPSTALLAITNSTVVGNAAHGTTSSSAGGIEQEHDSILGDAGPLSLVFATVATNSAASGANIGDSADPDPVTTFATSISDPLGGGTSCDGLSLVDDGFTHVTDTSCGTAASPDPQLGALADDGGPTLTMLPAATSPLLDQVRTDACLARVTRDQRGVSRPQGAACDVGAVERDVAPADEPTAAPAVGIVPRFTG